MKSTKAIYEEVMIEAKSLQIVIKFPSTEKRAVLNILKKAKIPYDPGVEGNMEIVALDRDDWEFIEQDMKKIRYTVVNEALTEAKTFMRLPGHVIGNELYQAKQNLESIVSSLTNGDDYIDKEMTTLIKMLQNIRKEAKKFEVGDEVPVSYEYKAK